MKKLVKKQTGGVINKNKDSKKDSLYNTSTITAPKGKDTVKIGSIKISKSDNLNKIKKK